MANEQNLVSLATRSQRERQEIARKGQEASTKAKAEKKLIRERILERMKEEDWDAYIDGIIERAKENKADAEFLRDTIGQKPTENVAIQASEEAKSDLKELLEQRRNAGK